jgi:hypothetical protein
MPLRLTSNILYAEGILATLIYKHNCHGLPRTKYIASLCKGYNLDLEAVPSHAGLVLLYH